MYDLTVERIYDSKQNNGSLRVLVDRLWPRGLSKEEAKLDVWLKAIAPSDKLRKWFDHDPEKWQEFKEFYFKELKEKQDDVRYLLEKLEEQPITLLYATKEERYNNAVALKAYIHSFNQD